MRRTFVLLLLMLCACGSPADDAAARWVDFLDTHRESLEAGTFDAVAFQQQGQAIVDELITHRSPKDSRILLNSITLKDWDRAGEEFRQAANKLETESGDDSATRAFKVLIDRLKADRPSNP
jgi:hypothetical protein